MSRITKKTKKAQAALEFLMTYAWVIFVVLVVLGALSYLGVLNVNTLLPDTCTGPVGIDCLDMRSVHFGDTTVLLSIKNGLGQKVNLTSGSAVSSKECNFVNITASTDTTPETDLELIEVELENGQKAAIKITCDVIQGNRFKMNLNLKYKNIKTGFDHAAVISVKAGLKE